LHSSHSPFCLSSIYWHSCAGASFAGPIAIEPAIFASNPTIYVTKLRPTVITGVKRADRAIPFLFFVTPKTLPLI